MTAAAVLTVLLAGCHAESTPSPGMRATPRASSAVRAPVRDSAAGQDPWLLAADSALRRHLDRQLFLAAGGFEPDMADCSGDEGSDNPTLRAAVVEARPIRHSAVRVDTSEEYPNVIKVADFDVEVRSVAIMVPGWLGKVNADSAPVNRDQYEARIAPRVDTFSINLEEFTTRRPGTPRWAVCDPRGPTVSDGDGPGFWNFAHAKDEPNEYMAIVRWTPAGGSWAQIVALAEGSKRIRD